MCVSCECCVLSGGGLCDGLITRQRNAIECDVSQRDLENSTGTRPRPGGVVEPRKKTSIFHRKQRIEEGHI